MCNWLVYLSFCLFSDFCLVYSLLPGVPVSALPCLALLDLLKTVILSYILVSCSSFLPAVCTVTEDQTYTVSGAHSPRFFFFESFFVFCLLCFPRGLEVATRHPTLASCYSAWEFGGIAASAASAAHLSSSPATTKSARRLRLTQACRSIISTTIVSGSQMKGSGKFVLWITFSSQTTMRM